MLDGLADAGFLTKTGNKYHTILIDSAVYSPGVAWHELSIDVPMYGFQQFPFIGEEAQDALAFWATEIEIKFTGQGKEVTVTPFQSAFSNPDNADLSNFFNNSKTVRPKVEREKKLKDKKDKQRKK